MKDWKNESMIDALSYCSLRDIPEVDKGEDFWIKALALVQKADGSFAYVYVAKDLDTLEIKYMKVWGSVSAIKKVIEYYPFSFLKAQYIPKFKTNNKAERIKYLTHYDKKEGDWDKLTLKELDKEVYKRAIKRQMETEERQNK